jgi:hypothetical protein
MLTCADAEAMLPDADYIDVLGSNGATVLILAWERRLILHALRRCEDNLTLADEKKAARGFGLCITDFGAGHPLWIETKKRGD